MPKKQTTDINISSFFVFLILFLALGLALNAMTFSQANITGHQTLNLSDLVYGPPAPTTTTTPTPTATTAEASGFGSYISNMFLTGNIDALIAKYLLFGMLFVFILAIFLMGDFPPYTPIKVLLALGIAFLAVAFITPADLYGVMTTYGALGITLSTLLPFIVLLTFSTAILTGKGLNVGKMLVQRFLWLLFTGFLIYRTVMLYVSGEAFSGIVVTITLVALGLAIWITIWNHKFIKQVFNMLRMVKIETTSRKNLDTNLNVSENVTNQAAHTATAAGGVTSGGIIIPNAAEIQRYGYEERLG